jgi:hypothetical protein
VPTQGRWCAAVKPAPPGSAIFWRKGLLRGTAGDSAALSRLHPEQHRPRSTGLLRRPTGQRDRLSASPDSTIRSSPVKARSRVLPSERRLRFCDLSSEDRPDIGCVAPGRDRRAYREPPPAPQAQKNPPGAGRRGRRRSASGSDAASDASSD